MKILALSDSHTCGAPSGWESVFDKRVVGLFNHHYLRKHQHNQEYIDIAVDYILQNPPDVVICTGDVSTSGEPSEFEFARKKLEPLVKDKRFEFFFIPGNHDNYVKNPTCQKAMLEIVKTLNNGRFAFDDLPFLYETDELEFCFVNECYPVNLILSCGKMTKAVSDYVCKWALKEKEKPKILVGHYPLEEGNPILRCRHRLYGQKKVIKLLKSGNIDLSLCGHVHYPTPNIDERGRGEIIIGSVTRNACLASIDYNKENDIFDYKKIDLTLS